MSVFTAGLAIYAAGSTVENRSRTDEYKTYGKYIQSFGIVVGIVGIVKYFLPVFESHPAPVAITSGIRLPGLTMDADGIRMPGLTMDSNGIRMPGLTIG